MAVLIFNLRHVPDDEAQDVRELLLDNNIEFHETSAGFLGMAVPGLWVVNEEQAEEARHLIDEYQQLRQKRVQEEYRLKKRTSMDMFKENPVRYSGSILAIILLCKFIVYLFAKLL